MYLSQAPMSLSPDFLAAGPIGLGSIAVLSLLYLVVLIVYILKNVINIGHLLYFLGLLRGDCASGGEWLVDPAHLYWLAVTVLVWFWLDRPHRHRLSSLSHYLNR